MEVAKKGKFFLVARPLRERGSGNGNDKRLELMGMANQHELISIRAPERQRVPWKVG